MSQLTIHTRNSKKDSHHAKCGTVSLLLLYLYLYFYYFNLSDILYRPRKVESKTEGISLLTSRSVWLLFSCYKLQLIHVCNKNDPLHNMQKKINIVFMFVYLSLYKIKGLFFYSCTLIGPWITCLKALYWQITPKIVLHIQTLIICHW